VSDNARFEYPLTFFYTRDLAQCDQFYLNVLGFDLARDQGDCHIYRVSDGHYVGFCERPQQTPEHPFGVILTFVTSDVDGWYYRLRERGVKFDHPPALSPEYNIYHCFFPDPNGYLIEIQRFNEPL